MPRDGAGTMIRETPVATGTTAWLDTKNAGNINITTGDHDFHDQDIAAALTTSIATDGQSVITADIPWNGHKITGLANGSAATDAAAFGQVPLVSDVLIQTQTVTSPVSSVDFTGIGSTYNTYIIQLSAVFSASASAVLEARLQQSAVFATTNYYGTLIAYDSAGGTTVTSTANGAALPISSTAPSNTGWSGTIGFLYPQGAGAPATTCEITIFGGGVDSTAVKHFISLGGGTLKSTSAAITGIRFLCSTGNITGGIFSLYGKKS